LGVVLTLWCIYFFRNPVRVTPTREGLVVSPADGMVLMIVAAPPPLELSMGDAPLMRISIFMSPFDVHVNRIPVSGKVKRRAYFPGRFFNAALDKASTFNERLSLALELPDGRDLAVVQIAGLVARRIRCDAVEGQTVRAGERFGLIRFGSRADVYLPDGANPLVVPGQRVIAGETVLADLASLEGPRVGESR
jgi:phosphatidylserine decarboxylase